MLSDVSECPLCLNHLDEHLSVTHCGHLFHTECIENYRKIKRTECPICRSEFDPLTVLFHSFTNENSALLQKKIKNIVEEKKELEDSKLKLLQNLSDLKIDFESKQKHLNSELDNCHKLLSKKIKEYEKCEKINNDYSTQLDEKKNELNQVKDSLKKSKLKLRNCENSSKKKKDELIFKEKKIEDLMNSKKKCKVDLESKQKELDSMQNELDFKLKEIENLQNSKKKCEYELDLRQRIMEAKQKELEYIKNELEDLRHSYKNKEIQLADMREEAQVTQALYENLLKVTKHENLIQHEKAKVEKENIKKNVKNINESMEEIKKSVNFINNLCDKDSSRNLQIVLKQSQQKDNQEIGKKRIEKDSSQRFAISNIPLFGGRDLDRRQDLQKKRTLEEAGFPPTRIPKIARDCKK